MARDLANVGGCEIVVEHFGNGRPIVVLRGEANPGAAVPFLQALATDYEIVVPHYMGWSHRARAHVCTVRGLALIAQEYIEQHSGPVPVIDLSLGGWVAAEIAANAPSLISSLVLLSPIGLIIDGAEEQKFDSHHILTDTAGQALYGDLDRVAETSDDGDGSCFIAQAGGRTASRFGWQRHMHDASLERRLQGIQATTLLVSGNRDTVVDSRSYYNKYAKLIPFARHEIVMGAGHYVEEDEPLMAAQYVRTFISGSKSDRDAA